MSMTSTQWTQFSGVFPRPPFDPAEQPETNLVPAVLDLNDRVGDLEFTPGAAIDDVADSQENAPLAGDDPVSLLEFNALVTSYNIVVGQLNDLIASHNLVLQALRDHNIIAVAEE